MKSFFQFTSLKLRIAFIYASLLGVTLACVVLATSRGIDRYGEEASLTEMAVNVHVFDQILKLRVRRLEDSARVMSHDFGFRSAVATLDPPTITSVLDSLASRADAEYAFAIGMDGRSAGARGHHYPAATSLMPAIARGQRYGVIRVDGRLAMAVAEPVKAPNPIGWLILAHPLDGREMATLAGLAPSQLIASVVPAQDMPRDMAGQPARATRLLRRDGDALLTWHAMLPALQQGVRAELILQRPLKPLLANYTTLKHLLAVIAFAGMAIVTLASWRLAATITLPLRRLEEAARDFGRGISIKVPVESADEVGRLAETYNSMVAAIEDREQKILDAMHDPLTLLPNRRLFLQRLTHELGAMGPDDAVILILADIDDFKNVNDTLGHPGGDALLCEIGARLAARFGDGQIARLGGDEFAILLAGKARALDMAELGNQVVACFNQEALIGGDVVIPSGSVGMAMTTSPDDRDTILLMKRADLALYAAKGAGKNCAHLFDSVLDESSRRQRALELDLRRAIRDQEFRFVFQPIYALRDNRLTGFEALMRWRRQDGQDVSPAHFIPAAEKSGLINALGEWAIIEACRRAMEWGHDATVSVNISPRQLMNPALFGSVVDALVGSSLAPQRLIIEITESVFIENMSVALQTLRKLQAIGVRIALDDFGTGYSSLNFLRSFPFDRVKIDKCFVDNLAPDSSANAVIRAILTLADALGIETVAEGVETEIQLAILREPSDRT
jgi:diguanylate cyclase (GGDEF)-like protein